METSLTIIDQVKEIEARLGVAFELDVTDLAELANCGKKITSVDDPSYKDVRVDMQKRRKYITDYFMSARRNFNRIAKGVIQVEKIVLEQFVPEENRLIQLEKDDKARKIREARLASLPQKRERVATAGITFADDEILAMEDVDFELAFATRLQEKLEADRIAEQVKIDEENRKIAEANAELQREKDKADAIEKARQEERARAEEALRMQKEKAERDEQERIARIERKAREAEEAEQKRIASAKYQAFLKKNGYNEATDIIIDNKLYRLVAEYK